jgi:threonine/homoserine/homoserine lactone efflux protein
MPPLSTLSIFMIATLILLLTPGPAVLYIVARSIDQGRRAGLFSVLGIEVGNFSLVLATAFGLSVILRSSGVAFFIVKYLGAAYLIFLGIRRLLTLERPQAPSDLVRKSPGKIIFQGVLVAVLNPKTALFFLAFLPQFVDPSGKSVASQFLFLGCIFVGMAVLTDSLYALLAGTVGAWLKGSPWFSRVERYVIGSIYVGLGVAAALSGFRLA